MEVKFHLPIAVGHLTPEVAHYLLSSFLALAVPYITAFVNNRKMSDQQRVWMAAGISFFVAFIQTIATGFNFVDLATSFMVILPLAQVYYHAFAMKLGVRKFENATSPEAYRDDLTTDRAPEKALDEPRDYHINSTDESSIQDSIVDAAKTVSRYQRQGMGGPKK